MTKVAIILPPLAKDDYERLKASIEKDGQQIPILIDSNTDDIVDGEHRLKICQELGLEPLIEKRALDPKEAIVLKISLNLARRHLTAEQKDELSVVLRRKGFTQEETAKLVGLSRPTVRKAEKKAQVLEKVSITFIPDLRYSIKPEQEEEIVTRVDKGETQAQVASDYGISQQRVGQIKQKVKAREEIPAPVEIPPFPEGRYRCIVIDPPWPMKKIERDVRPAQGIALDYPTMSLDEITALPIADLADPDGCHIYLWTTHRFLPVALGIFNDWGAKYQCLMTWVKNVGFTPYSWMYSTEHVLFGRIGTLDLLKKGLRLDFEAKVKGHSVKPDIFYKRVIEASPSPRLEMFARRSKREGFDVWGAGI